MVHKTKPTRGERLKTHKKKTPVKKKKPVKKKSY